MKKKVLLYFIVFTFCLSKYSNSQSFQILKTDEHIKNLIDVASNEKYFATSSADNFIRIFDHQNGELIKILQIPTDSYGFENYARIRINQLQFIGNDAILCGGLLGDISNRTLKAYLLDIDDNSVIEEYEFNEPVVSLSINNKLNHITFGLGNGELMIYSRGNHLYSVKLNGIPQYIHYSPSGEFLYVMCSNGMVYKYSSNNYKLQKKEKINIQGTLKDFKVSKGGNHLAYLDIDVNNEIKLINPNTLQIDNTIKVPYSITDDHIISDIEFSSVRDEIIFSVVVYDQLGIAYGTGTPKVFKKNLEDKSSEITEVNNIPKGIMINKVKCFSENKIFFSDIRCSWGIVSPENGLLVFNKSGSYDFSNNLEDFLLSFDGSIVSFTKNSRGDDPVSFSVQNGIIEGASFLNPPKKTPVNLIRLDKSKDSIAILPGEKSVNFCISSKNEYIIVSFTHRIICIDPDGKLLWNTPTLNQAQVLNISGNQKFLVAAMNNGTICWFNLLSGKKLFTLFIPFEDEKNWVIWTPEGHIKGNNELANLIINLNLENQHIQKLIPMDIKESNPDVINNFFR